MEEQKKPADHQNKRQRVSENAESSNRKSSHLNGLKVHLGQPVGVALSPGVTRMRPLASPSPVAKAKPIAVVKPTATAVTGTGPATTMAPAPAPPSPVAMKTPTPAPPPSPVAMKTPTPVAPSPVVTLAPAPAAPSCPVATMTPVHAAPSPVATKTPAPAEPSAVATKTPTPVEPSPVAAAMPAAVVNPPATVKHELEDGGVLEIDEQVAAAMVAVAPMEEDAVILEVNKKWLHCAACPAPLKRPIFMCEDGHVVCSDCGGGAYGDGGANKHCDMCGHATTYTHIPYMDGLVGACKVPCPYRNFGCARSIAYHSAAEHPAKCAHAPCYCFECAFQGSPASLLRHLTEESGRHCWPMQKIKYQICRPLVVPASEHRLLLVAEEDGRVFLLAVGAGRGAAGVRPVTVVCVRGNVDADARPVYTGVLWVDGPPAAAGHLRSSFQLKGDVANCGVPGEVDMEHGRLHAHVNPEMLHGESKEIHLRICITKF